MEKGTVQPAILVIALISIVALGGYFFSFSQNKSEPVQSVKVSESIKPTPIDNNLGSGSAKGD